MSRRVQYNITDEELLRVIKDNKGFRSPAFQFYPNDWLASNAVAVMSLEETGAYINLLACSWGTSDCGLVLNDMALACFSRVTLEKWLEIKDKVLVNFFISAGYVYNRRLLLERYKQINNSLIRAKAAKSKGSKRIDF